jgi:hypothetical protein
MAKQTSSLAKIIPLRSAEAMTTSANTSQQLERASKELDTKQKERDEKQLKSQDKLITNLDKLVAALQNNMGAKVSGNRAAELGKSVVNPNYKQGGIWDQRSVADQAKDLLGGRKGSDGKRDAFDPNSLRYKVGSLKGLADTTGLIQPDSFFGNLLGRREDRMKRTDTLTKLNPQMKNLKQFGGDEKKVRAYYDKQYKDEYAPAQAKLQGEQYKLDSLMASGISEKELERTVGGKKQIKSRDVAAADLLMKDKFKKGELQELTAKPEMSKTQGFTASGVGASNVIPFPSKNNDNFTSGAEKEGELENIRLMNEQNRVLISIQENTAVMPKLLLAFENEAKREAASDQAQLEAAAAAGAAGGSGLMDMAGDLLGKGKGGLKSAAGKAGGFLKGAGGFLAKRAGPLAAITSVVAGGMTAYEGYNAASDAEAKGEITKEQATVKKGGAIGEGTGQAVGGAVGALKGAALGAAVGSVIPVVGTAIGGLVGAAIGGIGGSFLGGKIGNFVGETGGKIKNWFSGPNSDKSGAETKVQTMAATPNSQGQTKIAAPIAAPKQEPCMVPAAIKTSGTSTQASQVPAAIKTSGTSTQASQVPAAIKTSGTSTQASQTFPLKSDGTASQTFPLKSDGTPVKVKQKQVTPKAVQPAVADRVAKTSADVQASKDAPAPSSNVQTNVSQTNVQQRNTQAIKPPIRNQDSSFYNMVEARYVY